MSSRILVAPAVGDRGTLRSLSSRVAFYLARVDVDAITFVVAPDLLTEARAWLRDPAASDDLDTAVLPRLRSLSDRLRAVSSERSPRAVAGSADIILVWDTDGFDVQAWERARKTHRAGVSLFEIDPQRTRLEASVLADVAHRLDPQLAASHATDVQRLARLIERLGGRRDAVLVATGPSARQALTTDLDDDAVRIVCNTVVLDRELMDHLRPQVLVFADPIFHFGPSTYAARFRAAVAQESQRHDLSIVVPERYAEHLRDLLPPLGDRVIGVRVANAGAFLNLELANAAYVRSRPNILTMLMLPVATTLAQNLHLIGFDGRTPGEHYFWQHGETVQLHDELDAIRRIHPAFFSIDYAEYYDEHVGSVDTYVRAIEATGRTVVADTESHIPALRARWPGAAASPLPSTQPDAPLLVLVDPDYSDAFGHHGPMTAALRRSSKRRRWQVVTLGSRAYAQDEPVVPWFTHPTDNPDAHGTYAHVFHDELAAAATGLLAGRDAPTVFALYTAALWHLPEVVRVLSGAGSRAHAVVNLMRAHPQITAAAAAAQPQQTWAAQLLRSTMEAATPAGVTITVDSDQLADDVELLTGRRPSVWPMVALTEGTLQAPESPTAERDPGSAVRLYCPVRPQISKGYADFATLAETLAAADEPYELTARTPGQPTEVPLGVEAAVTRLRDAGARLLDRELAPHDYVEELLRADVVVLPQHATVFRTRTSAMLIDALLLGRPVVAARSTWLGQHVERFGAGVVFEAGDTDDIARAVRAVAQDIGRFQAQVRDALPAIRSTFEPEALFDFLAGHAQGAGDVGGDTAPAIGEYADWSAAVFAALADGYRATSAARAQASERETSAAVIARTRDHRMDRLRNRMAAQLREERRRSVS